MASLVQSVNYGTINATDTTKMRYYVIQFASESYTLLYDTTYDVQISSAVELVVKA